MWMLPLYLHVNQKSDYIYDVWIEKSVLIRAMMWLLIGLTSSEVNHTSEYTQQTWVVWWYTLLLKLSKAWLRCDSLLS